LWCNQWERNMAGRQIAEADLVSALTSCFVDDAHRWFYSELSVTDNGRPWTAAMILQRLKERFYTEDTMAVNRQALMSLIRQGQGDMTVDAYYNAFVRKANLTDKMSEHVKIDFFVDGLCPNIRQQLQQQHSMTGANQTLLSAFTAAKRLELIMPKTKALTVNMAEREILPT
jgi:ferric iron reductase protein FhuF